MLAETIMQVLSNAPLFSGAYIQDGLFQVLSFRDVNAGGNDVMGRLSTARKQGTGPCDQALFSMPREPGVLIVLRKEIGTQHFKHGLEAICFLRKQEQVPDIFALDLFHRITRSQFTSRVEA